MAINLLGNITPIHVIGDSHCLQYTEVLFEREQPRLKFNCKTRFFLDLPARLYVENGALNPQLFEALRAQGILNANAKPAWLEPDASATYLSGRPALSPIIVLFAGEVDVQWALAQLGNDFDFELPDDPGYGVDFDKQPVDYATVHNRITSVLAPFVLSLEWFRQLLPRTMVHALPPRSLNDGPKPRMSFGVLVDAPLRAKVGLIANRYLRDECVRLGVPFIDPWDSISQDGYLRRDLDLDGLHVNRAGLPFSLDLIVDTLLDHTASIANPVRYSVAKANSPAYEGPKYADAESWAHQGYILDSLGGPAVAALDADCHFEAVDGNEWVSPEWVGYPRAGRPGALIARPSEAMTERAARLLCVGHGRAVLQAGDIQDLTIINFRPIEIAAGASVAVSALPTPPGCRRALLFLGGVGLVSLTDKVGGAITERPTRTGSILVYDPSRIDVHARAGEEAARFVEIMLMPRYVLHPFRVVAAGLNDWPADPFQYPVAGLTAYPPFAGDLVRETA